jgi:hypothetical protein
MPGIMALMKGKMLAGQVKKVCTETQSHNGKYISGLWALFFENLSGSDKALPWQ